MTIRELMLIVLSVAVAIAGLRSGGILASLVIGVSAITTVCIAIVAFVGHRRARVSSIGFLIPVLAYAMVVNVAGDSEIQLSKGVLPTTQLLWPAYKAIVRVNYSDQFTGQFLPDDDIRIVQRNSQTIGGMGGVMVHEMPVRESFASLAHLLFAMLFGYVGSKFALWVNRSNTYKADEQSVAR